MPTIEERLAALESLVADLADAHDALDSLGENLFYKIQFVMDSVVVKKKDTTAILDANGNAPVMQATLSEFFMRDGEKYIAALKAQADALQKKINGRAAILDVARDTLADLSAGTPAAGHPASEATAGPRLVPTQA